GEPAPDDLLGPSVAVHVGRVHERAAGLEEPVELLVSARLVALYPECHRAQAQARHRATASPQSSIVHTARLSVGVTDVRTAAGASAGPGSEPRSACPSRRRGSDSPARTRTRIRTGRRAS